MRKRFRRRAAIEPVITHFKHDFGLYAFSSKASKAINSISCWCRSGMELPQMDARAHSFWASFFSAPSLLVTSLSLLKSSPDFFKDRPNRLHIGPTVNEWASTYVERMLTLVN
jgi:hypothetical protein